jgi:DNA-binding transcriptional ArsR family regulator
MTDIREWNGVELRPHERELLTVLIEENPQFHNASRGMTSTEVMEHLTVIQHRSQLSRSRKRLKEAGLIEVGQQQNDGPLQPVKIMAATDDAEEHLDYLRWESEDTLEDRVERLERIVESELLNE